MFTLKDELIYIIIKTHQLIDFRYSEEAKILLLDTAAAESGLGKDFRQHGYCMWSDKGAFSPWQIELRTDNDTWENYIIKRPVLCCKIKEILGTLSHKEALMGNLYYACAMARFQYSRHKEPLPPVNDIKARFDYYKKYFNSRDGDTTFDEFVAAHKKYVI